MYIVQYGCRHCVWSPSSLEPFTYFWKCHLKFQKILKKYVHIDTFVFLDVYYKNANPQSQIHCIMGYTKKTKCNKVWRRTIRKPRSVIFSFLCRVNYNILALVLCILKLCIITHMYIYFSEFFDNLKMHFSSVENKELQWARKPN
jgi:hypothetical protein